MLVFLFPENLCSLFSNVLMFESANFGPTPDPLSVTELYLPCLIFCSSILIVLLLK